MSEKTTKLTVHEGIFWQRVYLLALKEGKAQGAACTHADFAIEAYRKRAK